MEQLRNLKNLQELNLQFNSITQIPPLRDIDFVGLEVLNLSYNKLNFESIRSLYICRNLKQLDLAANNLEQLPDDLFHFENLEDLNLSSNFFSSVPSVGSPVIVFKTLGGLRRLKRLNLSRNKFFKFHSEMLDQRNDFEQLQELDISFNMIDSERNLWYLAQTKAINVVDITGNPLAMPARGPHAYQALEYELTKNLSAVIINDHHLIDDKGYMKRKTNKQNHWPYPNPIKLLSREV
jgi:Leucine-rich repeat (LRR) protein